MKVLQKKKDATHANIENENIGTHELRQLMSRVEDSHVASKAIKQFGRLCGIWSSTPLRAGVQKPALLPSDTLLKYAAVAGLVNAATHRRRGGHSISSSKEPPYHA
ncbi:hypothetical protein MRX96_009468 [Rhipicephalus microplus]